MTATPCVSVVLYVRDGEPYLPELLASVFAQTHQDFELCVVDDGSTDATAEILAGLADPRVRVTTTGGNGRDGLHRTFNQCLAMARADLVAIANADDVWRPTKLERQVATFAADPGLDVCTHDASFIDQHGRVTFGGFRQPASLNPTANLSGRRFVIGDMVPNPTVMFRREIVRVIGVQETGWVHDFQFWMKAALAGCSFLSLPDRLVKYRVHEASHSTSSHRAERIRTESLEMVRWMVPRYGIGELYPELASCTDGPLSEAYAHLDFATMLRRASQPELADASLATARRIAPSHVGAGTVDVQWFGRQPQVAELLDLPPQRLGRMSLPAARTVLALPGDVDDDAIGRAFADLLDGAADEPSPREPVVVLTDDDRTTAAALEHYTRTAERVGLSREAQIDLLQVRPGELDAVVEGNLLDGGTLLPVTGGPETTDCLARHAASIGRLGALDAR